MALSRYSSSGGRVGTFRWICEDIEEIEEPLTEGEISGYDGRLLGTSFGEEGAWCDRCGSGVGESITGVVDGARGAPKELGGYRAQPDESGGHVVAKSCAEHDPWMHGHRCDASGGVAGGLF